MYVNFELIIVLFFLVRIVKTSSVVYNLILYIVCFFIIIFETPILHIFYILI